MEFRRNIMLSAAVHVALVIAVSGIVADRGAAFRVPESTITVALLEGLLKGGPSEASGDKDTTRTNKRAGIVKKKDHTQEQPGHAEMPVDERFLPIHAGEKKETQAVQGEKRETGVDITGVVLQPQGSGRGGQSSAPTGASQSPMSGAHIAGGGGVGGTGGLGNGQSDVIGAVRAAIEKAKNYPPLARKRGVEGTATTEFIINSKGYPENIRIVQSSGSDILDAAARNTVLRASPFPHFNGGIEIPITFRLKED